MRVHRHIQDHVRLRHVLLIMGMAFLAVGTGGTLTAQSVIDRTSCGHFETWEDAQAALESGNNSTDTLDPDDDGVACESAFGVGDGDIPADQMACSNFPDQAAAQAHYDATTSAGQRDILDPDGDGVACEDAFGVVIDPTSCGHFDTQEDAQEALDDPDYPDRENLDADGDGIACEDRFGEPAGEAPAEEAPVSRLPSTGAGTGSTVDDGRLLSLSMAASLLLIAGGAAYRIGASKRR